MVDYRYRIKKDGQLGWYYVERKNHFLLTLISYWSEIERFDGTHFRFKTIEEAEVLIRADIKNNTDVKDVVVKYYE